MTSADEAPGGVDSGQTNGILPTTSARQPPILLVAGLFVGLVILASTRQSIHDVDVYWHMRAGGELLDGIPANQLGLNWSFAPDPLPWVTTQWAAEVALHKTHALMGWPGLVWYRTLTALIAVGILALSTLRGRPGALAGFPFMIASTAVIIVSQERPNQVTLIGAAALGSVLVIGLTQGRLPNWWALLPLTWIWANFHGGWVLVPATLGLVLIGRALDHGLHDRTARRALALFVGSLVIGTLTPAGFESTVAALRFSQASDFIQEWTRAIPLKGIGYTSAAMVITVGIAWTRYRVPRSEAFATLMLVLFGWTAVRNVAPSVIILAPLAARALVEAFPGVGRGREPRWSAVIGGLLVLALTITGLATATGTDPLPYDKYPVTLAERIRDLPGPQRVLNDYNVAGFVLHFADPADQVGIDGRSDRYPSDYIEAYVGLDDLRGDWESLLAELDPTSALLKKESPLAQILVAERGWTLVQSEGDWALLTPPAA